MANKNNDWAAVQRVIEAEKSRSWAEVERFAPLTAAPVQRRRAMRPRLIAAATVVLVVAGALLFTLGRRPEAITLDQLPFFATASSDSAAASLSRHERERGQRLAGWMTLARQNPGREAAPTGWLLTSDPGQIRKNTDKAIRETMLERFLRGSDHNQEV